MKNNIEAIGLTPEVNNIEASNNRALLCLENVCNLYNSDITQCSMGDDYVSGYREWLKEVDAPFAKNGIAAVIVENVRTHDACLCKYRHVTTRERRLIVANDHLGYFVSQVVKLSEEKWGEGNFLYGEKGLSNFKSFSKIQDVITNSDGSIDAAVEYTDGSNGKILLDAQRELTQRDLVNINKGLEYKKT